MGGPQGQGQAVFAQTLPGQGQGFFQSDEVPRGDEQRAAIPPGAQDPAELPGLPGEGAATALFQTQCLILPPEVAFGAADGRNTDQQPQVSGEAQPQGWPMPWPSTRMRSGGRWSCCRGATKMGASRKVSKPGM